MSSTLLTVIVLVVMWLVVLVPMIAKRREDADTARTVEKFSGTMRVLARRPAALLTQPLGSASSAAPASESSVPPAVSAARTEMLARRQRTLGTLLMLAAITAVLAIGWSATLWLVQLAVDALLVAYVGWLRAEAKRVQARRARRAASRRAARRAREPLADEPPTESLEPVPAESPAIDEEGRWTPRPVPLPTYLTAPTARESLRRNETIQLDEDDFDLSEVDDGYGEREVVPPRAVNG